MALSMALFCDASAWQNMARHLFLCSGLTRPLGRGAVTCMSDSGSSVISEQHKQV